MSRPPGLLPAQTEPMQSARVVQVIRETRSTVTIVFATDTPLACRPGQYVQTVFRLGNGRYRRAYSLSSVPSDPFAAITVKHVPGGKVSQFITSQLKPGDRFLVSPAHGEFVLPDSRAGRRFVFIAGGSGITPVMSLIRTLVAMPAPVRVRVVYYSHAADDIIFRRQLDELAAAHQQFDMEMIVTGPRDGWEGLNEAFSVSRVLGRGDDPSALYYVCGPDSLIDSTVSALAAAGVDAARMLAERFAVAATRERPEAGHPVTFIHRGFLYLPKLVRTRTRPGESLLDAAERVGIRVRSNCRNGTCGSCRAQLVRGEVSMDEPNGLSLSDAQAGRVLTCVAYPATPVILDLRS